MILIILQIVAVLANIYIASTENIKRVFIATFIFNVFNLFCYLLLNDITTVVMYIFITIRSFIYIYRDKYKIKKFGSLVPIIFIVIQIILGLYFMQKYIQILAICIPCYTCYYMWFNKTTQELRIGNIIANSAWFIYNIITGLYLVAAVRLVTIAVNSIQYSKHI